MGSITKSIFGEKPKAGGMQKGAMFQPYSYKSLLGSTSLAKDGDEYTFSQELDPRFGDITETGLGSADPFLANYLQQTQQPLSQFNYGGMDVAQREQDIFQQQAGLLQPAFAQQNQQLQSDLFGSGRMGLQLSGATAGAGRGAGMVNPDAYNLGLAQSRALAELAPQAREMAQQEQQQAFSQAGETYRLNQAAQNQQLQNLLAGYTGAMGGVKDVFDLEQALVGGAAGREQAIRSAASGAMTAPTQGSSGLLGTAVQAGATYYGTKHSDIRLKENLVSLGKVNGHNMYSWDWNELAKGLGIDAGTIGVIAQEVMEYMPQAVSEHTDGYYVVDYDMLSETL